MKRLSEDNIILMDENAFAYKGRVQVEEAIVEGEAWLRRSVWRERTTSKASYVGLEEEKEEEKRLG